MNKTCILAIVLIIAFSGCSFNTPAEDAESGQYESFRDIPGVTEEEILAIKALQEKGVTFVYGLLPSNELFYNVNGELSGFTVLFCGWLTELFGIPFEPKLFEWNELLAAFDSGGIDFTSELTATKKRRRSYMMTDPIANRFVSYFRLEDSRPVSDIKKTRELRFGFLSDAITYDDVAELSDENFIPVFIDNYEEAYKMLVTEEIDALLEEHTAEAAFELYGNVTVEPFFPLLFAQVSLASYKNENFPVISVMQKFLQSGGIRFLVELYNIGEHEYKKNKLFKNLSPEEKSYLENNHVVKFAAEHDNYPLSFYNNYDKKFQGICFDVLNEIEKLTGLRFELVNDQHDDWSVILNMLEKGEVSFISELIHTPEREGIFLWPSSSILTDYYALLSKEEHHNIEFNEIMYSRIGLVRANAHTEVFERWFPDHAYTVMYDHTNQAFNALGREIDLMMGSQTQLLIMSNFYERPGYKANLVFNYPYKSTFGFNKNEAVLCSIIDKALHLTDTEDIEKQWMAKTYDYRVKIEQARLPWLIGAIGLLFCVLVLVLFLFYRSKRLVKIQEESVYKTLFLANMSHEIRTPMNAIIGMAELILRSESVEESQNYAQDIKHAGNNLISIINDILDISKIEAGKLEIVPVNYMLSSLVNDTVNIINTRLAEKAIKFEVKVNENIPCSLIGDEIRLRQVMLNLLSNAVKYTEKGSVIFSIDMDSLNLDAMNVSENPQVWLKITVTDTGKGIKPEDQEKLFDNFVQVDKKKNIGIEGTGLGLAITKRLVDAMGGSISLQSEYGKGSVFTVLVPQGIESLEPFGKLELISPKYDKDAQKGKFTLPGARILVVDDLPVNLKVAEGLLSPYKANVETCLSGAEAIELVKKNNYDIVFMDHMMPDMDGMEAVKIIREFNKQVAIIALTANAIAGMKEKFIENGFNDFLSKPIDVAKLDEMLKRRIGSEKREEEAPLSAQDHLLVIPGIDTKKGIAGTGGIDNYLKVLSLYCNDAKERLPLLQTMPKQESISVFITQVHALKSASATIGAEILSKQAAELENAGKDKNMELIKEKLPVFAKKLSELINDINKTLETEAKTADAENKTENDFDISLLASLAGALKSKNGSEIERIMEEINQKQLNSKIKETLEMICGEVLMAEYEKAEIILDELLKGR